jgi:hypothetical protein
MLNYVYFIANSKNHTDKVIASFAFDDGPFSSEHASEAWGLLTNQYPGIKAGIESGSMSVLLSHESPDLHSQDQGLMPGGNRLNFPEHKEINQGTING